MALNVYDRVLLSIVGIQYHQYYHLFALFPWFMVRLYAGISGTDLQVQDLAFTIMTILSLVVTHGMWVNSPDQHSMYCAQTSHQQIVSIETKH